ncbi:PREDICTED: flavonoid 3'-monooxygenase-like [Camelina sativa]|uniref:Flavonoid 3'-monooxygenase-like n=1 Tax=Camelina sativa TaxID=90675 RepID=A0ABM0VG59_CAMSA|nr:PREDICTED: flavonoid 3'-monooxygenase-like [Camelina sativa]
MSPISTPFTDNTLLMNVKPYAILVLIATLLILWYRFKRSPHPPLPPGPRGLPIVGNLPFLDPNLHTYFTNLAQSHGPIYKLNLGSKLTVVVNTPALAREILKDQDINFSNHDVPLTARTLTYGGLDLVWLPYGAEWRILRKVCVLKLLSRKTLDSFYELRRKEIRERTRYLYQKGQEESPVNVGEQIFLTMMNLTMNMLWGGSVKAEEMESVGTEFKGVISEITRLLGEPNISDFFPMLARFDLQGLVKKMHVCAREVDAILDRAIEQMQRLRSRDGDDGECKDFLQHLMKLKEQEADSEVPITVNHVKAVLMDMVVGGTDTSTNTIEFAMAELIRSPELMKRAQQELEEVVGKDNIVEESHIARLPYVVAIMKETLRLYPTIPLLVPHRPTETAVVGGYTVPKNTKIFINAWSIQRDPNVWENPTEFRPERFLDDKSCDFNGTDYRFLPFGSGRRICAGIALAERMVLYTLATLVHSFEWKIPEGHVLDLEEKFGIVLKLKTPLVALPVPRLSNSNLYL